MKRQDLSIALLAITACLLWSTAFVSIKIGLKYTTPLQFAGIRFFLSGLLLLLLCRPTAFISAFRTNLPLIMKVSALQTFALYALFYWSIQRLDAALAAIIIGAQPLFSALVAHIAMDNDKMGLSKSVTISMGIVGIVLIAAPHGISGPQGWTELTAMLTLVVVNIISGLGNVVVSKQGSILSPITLNSAQMVIGGSILFLTSLLVEPFTGFIFPPEYYLSLLWLSFLSAAAFSLWFFLLQKPEVKVSNLNIYKFIIPVVGAALSWTILPNESPDMLSVTGMIIIGLSIMLYGLINSRTTRSPAIKA